jgi:exodeoxyribonuclease VII large subunit
LVFFDRSKIIPVETYRLFELQQYIRRTIALNVPEPVWIRCELAQVSESRGHRYLELVEKDDQSDELIAQSSAVIWQRTYRRIRRQRGKQLQEVLREGMSVLLKVQVDFHERYGLKLMVEDVDPGYTMGELEMRRRAILERLQTEDLLGKNRSVSLPMVLQRIAVLSAESAAGYADFKEQLANNPYGFRIEWTLFPTAMQGQQVEQEMLRQLHKIERRRHLYDAIVVIRGGGARLDLAAFDRYELAAAMAQASLPVLTGIGHEIDETVLDQVVNSALKTPTAVAEFIVQHNARFDAELWQAGQWIGRRVQQMLTTEVFRMDRTAGLLKDTSHRLLIKESDQVAFAKKQLPFLIRTKLKEAEVLLDFQEQVNSLLSVESALRRGFSITYRSGQPVASSFGITEGDILTTHFRGGRVHSVVNQVAGRKKGKKSDQKSG